MKHTRRLLCLFLTLTALFGLLPVSAAGTTVSVRSLDAPQVGERLDFTAEAALPALYTIEEICWFRAGGDTPGDTFDTLCRSGELAAAGRYLCRIYIQPAAGVTLTPGQAGSIGEHAALVGLWRGRWFVEYTFTALPSTRIAEVPLGGIELPTAGKSVRDYRAIIPTLPIGCTVTDVSWALGAQTLADNVTLRAGDALSCTVTVRADSGFRFADSPTATLCGQSPVAAIEQLTGQIYRFVFLFTAGGSSGGGIEAITVGSVSLMVATPARGLAVSAAVPLPSNGVSIKSAVWSPNDSTFAAGTAYTLTVTLVPRSGYTFSAVNRPVITLNGARMTLTRAAADSLTATYTFPPIDSPVTTEPVTPSPQPSTPTIPDDPDYVFPFLDVAQGQWYRSWVERAHRMGLINGKTAYLYYPDAEMTWAEAVKLAACLHQLNAYGRVMLENGTPWYQSYLDYCLEMGIIPRTASGEVPGYAEIIAVIDQPINRAAYVWLFSRSLPIETFPQINRIPDNAIPDVPVSASVLDDCIYLFYRTGIINGRDANGTFDPTARIKRGEVAAVLVRLMDPSSRVGPPANLQN